MIVAYPPKMRYDTCNRTMHDADGGTKMEDLSAKIKNMTLSKTERQIADYILENLNTIGLQTVSRVASGIGTSDTSVIRFIRKLGFENYSEFKKVMGEKLIGQYQEAASGGEKFVHSRKMINQSELINDVASCAMKNIQKTCEGLSRETIEETARILMKSHIKYIVGFRTTASCSLYMKGKLQYLLANVRAVSQGGSAALESLIDITEQDCVLMYSFPRYSQVNQTILEIAAQKGAPTILITDSVTSPLAAKADLVLSASISGLGFTNSYVAPICISEIILFSINAKMNETDSDRAILLDTYLARHKGW